jgi:hypothetical protein
MDNQTLEASRRYLRRRDKIGGYLPLLAMRPSNGEAWTRLWFTVRTLDDRSEVGGAVDELITDLEHRILPEYPELTTELRDLSRWTQVEAEIYRGGGVRTIADYFRLMYYRAFCPVYICGAVGLPGEPRAHLDTFALYVGYGAQLMDDTLDLLEDIEAGRFFVTQEELDLLGLEACDVTTPAGLRQVCQFRNKWALYFYLRGYETTSLFSADNRDLARSWLGFGLRSLLDGKIVPLPREILKNHLRYCHHFGVYLHLFDFPLPSEAWRYRILHPIVRRMIRTVSLLDIREADARFDSDPTPLPEIFQVSTVYGRSVKPVVPRELLPDRRKPVRLAHYGLNGVVPTLADLARMLVARRGT